MGIVRRQHAPRIHMARLHCMVSLNCFGILTRISKALMSLQILVRAWEGLLQ